MHQSSATEIHQTDFERIRRYIQQHCGIVVGDEKSYLIESRLARLVAETGCNSFTEFYELLEAGGAPRLRDMVVDAITTNETLWFRDRGPFEYLRNTLLPDLVSNLPSGVRCRIWSSGCSTGQEPYSVAMCIDRLAHERPELGLGLDRFEIVATDISPTVLYVAVNGRYDSLAIRRGIEEYYLERYFHQKGRVWLLDEKIKQAVTFQKFNLQEPFESLGRFDLILCRNVLIYFSEMFRRDLYDRLATTMNPWGALILGAAETPLGLTERYYQTVSDDCVIYRVKESGR